MKDRYFTPAPTPWGEANFWRVHPLLSWTMFPPLETWPFHWEENQLLFESREPCTVTKTPWRPLTGLPYLKSLLPFCMFMQLSWKNIEFYFTRIEKIFFAPIRAFALCSHYILRLTIPPMCWNHVRHEKKLTILHLFYFLLRHAINISCNHICFREKTC